MGHSPGQAGSTSAPPGPRRTWPGGWKRAFSRRRTRARPRAWWRAGRGGKGTALEGWVGGFWTVRLLGHPNPRGFLRGDRRCTRSAEQVEGGPGVSSPLQPVREQLLSLAPAPDHVSPCPGRSEGPSIPGADRQGPDRKWKGTGATPERKTRAMCAQAHSCASGGNEALSFFIFRFLF